MDNGEMPAPKPPHSIDLQKLKDAGQIQTISSAQLHERWLSRTDMLHLNPGHVLDLVSSPVASALIDPAHELFIQEQPLSHASIEALIGAEVLADRVLALDASQRGEALRIIVYLMEQEIGQNSPQEHLDLARLASERKVAPERLEGILWGGREVVHQFQAITILDMLLKEEPLGTLYRTVAAARLNTVYQRLTDSNWQTVRSELNEEFPESSS